MVVGGGLGKDDGVDDRANYGREARELRQKRKTRRLPSPRATRIRRVMNSLEKKTNVGKISIPTVKRVCQFWKLDRTRV
jgi:hypothetical protein